MISHLRKRFRHPAVRVIDPAIRSYLTGKKLRPSTAAALMRRVEAYAGELNALALCYFSAYDRDGMLDRTYTRIVKAWEAQSDKASRSDD